MWIAIAWQFISKWGLRFFALAKDSRTIQILIAVGLVWFMAQRFEDRGDQIRELRTEVAALEQQVVLVRKEVQQKEFTQAVTERVIERVQYIERETTDIIDEINDAPEEENAILPPITERTNARLECLLHPSDCN